MFLTFLLIGGGVAAMVFLTSETSALGLWMGTVPLLIGLGRLSAARAASRKSKNAAPILPSELARLNDWE